MSKSAQPVSYVRPFIAELFGTFFLALTAAVVTTGSSGLFTGYQSVFVPFVLAATVAVLVYLFIGISGANLNPAVSVAQFMIRSITATRMLVHIVAQVIGAWFGVVVARVILDGSNVVPSVQNVSTGVAEFVGAFFLMFTISMVVFKRVDERLSGVVIGGAIGIACTFAGVSGAGVFNPAIALGLGATGLIYLAVPFLGALAGAGVGLLLHESDNHEGA